MSDFMMGTKFKYRFSTSKHANLTIEQLWDLPLTGENSLDAIAVSLDGEINTSSPRSFVTQSYNPSVVHAVARFNIVKAIIDHKLTEQAKKAEATVKQSQIKVIKDALAQKELDELLSSSSDTLKAKLLELQK